jgi:hypothetical protein
MLSALCCDDILLIKLPVRKLRRMVVAERNDGDERRIQLAVRLWGRSRFRPLTIPKCMPHATNSTP